MEKKTMRDYVLETPSIALENINNYKELTDKLFNVIKDKQFNTIWLIASGSSYNACYCARTFMKKCLSREVKIVTPYTFTYYEHDLNDHDIALVITQSGLSTNAIEAVKKLKSLNKQAICLTGNIDSDIKNYADIVIDYGVKEELVGYVTKGVTTLALFLMLMAIRLSNKTEYLEELKKAISLNSEMIDKANNFINLHYKGLSSMHQIYMCAAGSNFGTALEGALKVGETIHIPSNCYEVEEYIHGPNLQLRPGYTIILFDGNDYASNRVKQVYLASREVSNNVYLISNNKSLADDNHVLSLSNQAMSEVSPIVYLPFVQLLSHTISSDLKSTFQHPLLKKFKAIASAKTNSFVNYDGDE